MFPIGKMISSERVKQGFSRETLAEKLGIATETLARYERGNRTPKPETVEKLAEILNVSTDYLMGRSADIKKEPPALPEQGEGPEEAQVVIEEPTPGYSNEFIRVPVYDDLESACAGNGYEGGNSESSVREFVKVPKWLIGGSYSTEPDRCPFIATIYGDSMAEANIPDGCQVLINPIAEAQDGNVIVADLDGKRMIKWIYWNRFDGGGELRSSSSRYPVRRFSQEDVQNGNFRYIGKVCRVLGMPTEGE